MKEITIQVPDGKRAEWRDGVLMLVDDYVRPQTFEEALKLLDESSSAVIEYNMLKENNASTSVIAEAKLKIIAEALNQEPFVEYNAHVNRYYPWFVVRTQEEYDVHDNTEDWVKITYPNSPSIYISFCNVSTLSRKNALGHSVKLTLNRKEDAEYCGKQFTDIWAEYMYGTERIIK